MTDDMEQEFMPDDAREANELAAPADEEVEPRRNRAHRDGDVRGSYSRVREVLETSNAWIALMLDERVSQYVRYTDEGVEAVGETPPSVRALLYNAATAILHANGVRYNAQHEMPFYAREAID